MRSFSLMFVAIALVMLGMFVIYLLQGPVDPVIAVALFVSFLACLVPSLYLLKPFESRERYRERREQRRRKSSLNSSAGDSTEGHPPDEGRPPDGGRGS
ncbi:MAG: hypothetical protein H0V53_00320 [Rubrobacter sp.]|nr:hypothetical protein [Rubrobacter sp.]